MRREKLIFFNLGAELLMTATILLQMTEVKYRKFNLFKIVKEVEFPESILYAFRLIKYLNIKYL